MYTAAVGALLFVWWWSPTGALYLTVLFSVLAMIASVLEIFPCRGVITMKEALQKLGNTSSAVRRSGTIPSKDVIPLQRE